MTTRRFRLFVYGTFLAGEADHELLAGAELLGEIRTREGYALVELGPLGGLVETASGTVQGELYSVSYETLAACDRKRDHPRLFKRRAVLLADGSEAHSYLLDLEQVRGRRRLRDGDWRARFSAKKAPEGPWASWARSRR